MNEDHDETRTCDSCGADLHEAEPSIPSGEEVCSKCGEEVWDWDELEDDEDDLDFMENDDCDQI